MFQRKVAFVSRDDVSTWRSEIKCLRLWTKREVNTSSLITKSTGKKKKKRQCRIYQTEVLLGAQLVLECSLSPGPLMRYLISVFVRQVVNTKQQVFGGILTNSESDIQH